MSLCQTAKSDTCVGGDAVFPAIFALHGIKNGLTVAPGVLEGPVGAAETSHQVFRVNKRRHVAHGVTGHICKPESLIARGVYRRNGANYGKQRQNNLCVHKNRRGTEEEEPCMFHENSTSAFQHDGCMCAHRAGQLCKAFAGINCWWLTSNRVSQCRT
jgi:hypothetical protein